MSVTIHERTVFPDPEILAGYQELLKIYSPSCVVADSQKRAGVMHSYIKPIDTSMRFVGTALTVRLEPGNQVDALHALKVAQPGDALVVDAAGETETSIWGGLMSGLCKQKGVVGAVVDGGIRDTDETRDIGLPIFSKSIVPRSTHTPYSGRMEPIEINGVIQCAGVVVNPGDIVLGDEIGVVVIPLENAAEVLKAAQKLAENEEKTRALIKEGKTVDELLEIFGRL